jgi:Replication initiation factor
METSIRIDWISVTSRSWGAMPHNDLDGQKTQKTKGAMGYTQARKYIVSGVLVMHNPDNPKMGQHIVYSGNSLSILEHLGTKSIEILKYHLDEGHMIARLDIAIDVYDSSLSIESLAAQVKEKKHNTNSKKHLHIVGSEGETLYIGSLKNRKKLLRIYDKGKEKNTGENWKRIELEMHGKPATMAGKEIIIGGLQVIPAIIKAYCDYPEDEVWVSIIGNEYISIRVNEEKTNDTIKWLFETVAPAFARQALADKTLITRWTHEVVTLMDSPKQLGLE